MPQQINLAKRIDGTNRSEQSQVAKTIKELEQSSKIMNRQRDLSRIALTPGKRVSKNGKIYWETRGNRSDKSGSRL